MARRKREVNVRITVWKARCLTWIDKHPRIGWYIAALEVVNVLLNVLDLFH